MLAFIEKQDRNFRIIICFDQALLIGFIFLIGQFADQITLKTLEGKIIGACRPHAKGIQNIPQEGIARHPIMEDDEFDVKALVATQERIQAADDRTFARAEGPVHIDRIDPFHREQDTLGDRFFDLISRIKKPEIRTATIGMFQ
jgi:hypothetical protein